MIELCSDMIMFIYVEFIYFNGNFKQIVIIFYYYSN